jgi:KipI family sensor histidine kinase inhibitor
VIRWRFETASECAFILYIDGAIDTQLNQQLSTLSKLINERLAPVLIDAVPSYSSILLIYDITKISATDMQRALKSLQDEPLSITTEAQTKRIYIPVYYSIETGEDLERVAQKASMSVEDVIKIHSSTIYSAFALGFAPGFAYLGQVDSRIATPRLTTPRTLVPKGSVAIADRQTAVYPAESPGGWNLIGQCPIELFNKDQVPYSLIQPTDQVQFVAIDQRTFKVLKADPDSWNLLEGRCV